MSRCRDISAGRIPDFVRGLLAPEEREAVAAHLETCLMCAEDQRVLSLLNEEDLPEPPQWFYQTLAGRVTARADNRRKRMRMLIPVWTGAVAAAAVLFVLLLPGPVTDGRVERADYALFETPGAPALGLEQEILSISETFAEELGPDLDFAAARELYFADGDLLPQGSVFEMMDDETMRIFEALVEEMARKRTGKV